MNIGVVGVGRLGSIHARIYKEISPDSSLYICDIDEAKGRAVAESFGAQFVKNYKDLASKLDLVSIATPTSSSGQFTEGTLEQQLMTQLMFC